VRESFKGLIGRILGLETHKEKESNLFLFEKTASSFYQMMLSGKLDMIETQKAFYLLSMMPNLQESKEFLTPKMANGFVEALVAIKKTYKARQRESENLIFWLTAYMKECSKYGKNI